jgi:nucleoside-diphosphate-sugar epimerase
MKIFLTGASGFIGKNFVNEAIKKKHFVYCLSRKNRKSKNKNIKWIKGELDANLSEVLEDCDVFVHLAALGVKRNKINSDEIFKTNIFDSYNLITKAIESNCKKFVIVSTSSEYGLKSLDLKRISKRDERMPKTFYGLSKVIFSNMIKNLSKKSKCKFRIMRLFPIYGNGESPERLFPSLKKAAIKGKNFEIKNPSEFRDFTTVDYAVSALVRSCVFKKKSKNFEIFHVSSGNSLTIENFAKKMWKKFKAKGKLTFTNKKFFFSEHLSDPDSNWK